MERRDTREKAWDPETDGWKTFNLINSTSPIVTNELRTTTNEETRKALEEIMELILKIRKNLFHQALTRDLTIAAIIERDDQKLRELLEQHIEQLNAQEGDALATSATH